MEPQDGSEEGFGTLFWLMIAMVLFGAIGFGVVLTAAGGA